MTTRNATAVVVTVAAILCLVLLLMPITSISPRATLLQISLNHPDSYDYVPSVLYDTESNIWRAWWCGFRTGGGGDAIWYASSPDGVAWTPPAQVFTVAAGQSWDNMHVCDPSIVMRPAGGILNGWKFAMYYNGASNLSADQAGCARFGDCNNRVGIALSNNGTTWTRYGANPIIDCAVPDAYGCGQMSIVTATDGYLSSMVRIDDQTEGVRAIRSLDGVHWFDEKAWEGTGGTPGMDILYDADGRWPFLAVFTEDGSEHVMGASSFGQPWQHVAWAPVEIRTLGSGWYRAADGSRPAGPLRVMFGMVRGADPGSDLMQQDLGAMMWSGL